jgi:hypothetical protein
MITRKIKHLHTLIHSMTRGERRRFTTFVGGTEKAENALYLRIFNFYARHGMVTDDELVKRVSGLKKTQLANIRAHLWHQILECLRSMHAANTPAMSARTFLDFALLLQRRGLYDSAGDYVESALVISEKSQNPSLSYHILYEQRAMQAEYLHRPENKQLYEVNTGSSSLIEKVNLRDKLLNTLVRLQSQYYLTGFVKNDAEFKSVTNMFDQYMPKYQPQKGTVHDTILYYQNKVWFYYITQDFAASYRFASKWVRLIENKEEVVTGHPELYIKGIHHSLNALFMAGKLSAFRSYFNRLITFGEYTATHESHDIRSMHEEYFAIHSCNLIFLTGMYDDGVYEISPLIEKLRQNPYEWNTRKLITINYKFACVYFGADQYHTSLDFLNEIMNSQDDKTSEDIRSFARILALICHYELGNELLVRYQIKAVYRFLHKMKHLQAVQQDILLFLKNSPTWNRSEMMFHFQVLRDRLIQYKNHSFERRPFLYLDIIAWLDSKLRMCRIQDVIRSRTLN